MTDLNASMAGMSTSLDKLRQTVDKIGNPKGKRCESGAPAAITKAKACFNFKADYDRSNCAKCFAKGGKKYQISNPKGKRCIK